MRVRVAVVTTMLVFALLVIAQQSSQQPISNPPQSEQQMGTPPSGQQPMSTPQTSTQPPMSMNEPSGQQPIVKTAQENTFKPVPNLPDCLTGTVERGDPKTGPYVAFVRETAGCTIPWHWHSANEQVMFASGTGKLEMKGQPAQTVSQGSYYYLPGRHQHQLTCPNGCSFYLTRDGAADVHYVDTAGNEISPETALAAVGEHTAAPVSARQ